MGLLVIDWDTVDGFCEHRHRDVWDGEWSCEQVRVLRAGAFVPLSSPSWSTWYVVTVPDWSSNRKPVPQSSLGEAFGGIIANLRVVAEIILLFEAFCCNCQGKRENCIVKHREVPTLRSGVPINGG